jgi:hypothetical protein
MTKGVLWTFGILLLISRGLSLVSAQAPQQLSSADEIRAGDALFVLLLQSQGFADTPESKAIEVYLQTIGDKVAQNRAAQAALQVSPRSSSRLPECHRLPGRSVRPSTTSAIPMARTANSPLTGKA